MSMIYGIKADGTLVPIWHEDRGLIGANYISRFSWKDGKIIVDLEVEVSWLICEGPHGHARRAREDEQALIEKGFDAIKWGAE